MPAKSTQLEAADIERGVLQIIGGLLSELGATRSSASLNLQSALERDLGLGSLERVELLVRCERRFGIRLPDELAQHAETPADWVRALSARSTSAVPASARRGRYPIVQPERQAPRPPDSARTWAEVLNYHAGLDANRVQIHLLEGDHGQEISYGKLLETASRVAAGLRARGLQPNETVAIMLPTSSDFFYAFFGVMLAGGVAVPIYPPARPDKIEEYVKRQVKILQNAQVRFLISFDRVRSVSNLMGLSLPNMLGVTSIEELEREGLASGVRPRALDVKAADIAFIQYTSGSTGDPKGVVLTQSNVLANVRGIGWAVDIQPDDIVVTWLPLYHDMGLIGSWLFSVYYGTPITVLSPLDFLARPERWLWALHDSGGTLCPAPNFAYELCARKIRDEALVGLNLSRWRIAINAGEAVLPDTLARFAERFGPYGFHAEAYVPCYGLAESSVALAFPPINRPPIVDTIERTTYSEHGRAVPASNPSETNGHAGNDANVVRFVANGAPLPGHEARLVDEEGREVGERRQGRILFRGPSRTPGYYLNAAATAAVMDADGWMDSGDLGYWADGELFVTGRAKDLIIKAGHNIVPQELEEAAAEVKGVRRGCVAAFGSRESKSGTERVVLVAETREMHAEERKRIKSEIIHRLAAVGAPPDRVVLVAPQRIPKTSSGKIRRNETRRLYEAGKLGGTQRAPWVQMLSLAADNAGAWTIRRARRMSAALNRAAAAAWSTVVCTTGAGLARVLPGESNRAGVSRFSARCLLRFARHRVEMEATGARNGHGAALYVANRAGEMDALVLAATLPQPVRLADLSESNRLPSGMASLLRPLVLNGENGARPASQLRDRIRHALEAGQSVVVLPDSAAGSAPANGRYRLDAFHAASLATRPIVPVGVRGTAHVLDPSHGAIRHAPKVVTGAEIDPGSCSVHDLAELRDKVRSAIVELCR